MLDWLRHLFGTSVLLGESYRDSSPFIHKSVLLTLVYVSLFFVAFFPLWLIYFLVEGLSSCFSLVYKWCRRKERRQRLRSEWVRRELSLGSCSTKEMSLMRLGTFNVNACVGSDNCMSVSRVADCLKKMDLDVVAIQDVEQGGGVDQVSLLAEEAGYPHFEFSGSGPSLFLKEGCRGVAILSRFPFLETREVCFQKWIGREKRSCLLANLPLPSHLCFDLHPSINSFWFGSSHLQNDITGYENRNQLESILKELCPTQEFVLGVDTNLMGWKVEDLAERLGLMDVGGSVGFVCEGTFPSALPVFRSDAILVRRDSSIRVSLDPELGRSSCQDEKGVFVSDHIPVCGSMYVLTV